VPRRIDIPLGTRFGRLVVLGEVGRPSAARELQWLCQCDCGNQKVIVGSSLRRGTQSCGCLHREIARGQTPAIDIAGQRFGSLVARTRVGFHGGKRATWECLCDCGKSCRCTVQSLRRGVRAHCGCLRSNKTVPHRMRTYKLSPQDILVGLDMQRWRCPWCELPLREEELVVDHDHAHCPGPKTCGTCVRGFLHRVCNAELGILERLIQNGRAKPTATAAAYIQGRLYLQLLEQCP
jgi:hypothetical protein